jgi:preprotein translocase subunit SecY
VVFNPQETADNLKKHGGFIPGIRPGERTAEFIDYVSPHHGDRRRVPHGRAA